MSLRSAGAFVVVIVLSAGKLCLNTHTHKSLLRYRSLQSVSLTLALQIALFAWRGNFHCNPTHTLGSLCCCCCNEALIKRLHIYCLPTHTHCVTVISNAVFHQVQLRVVVVVGGYIICSPWPMWVRRETETQPCGATQERPRTKAKMARVLVTFSPHQW